MSLLGNKICTRWYRKNEFAASAHHEHCIGDIRGVRVTERSWDVPQRPTQLARSHARRDPRVECVLGMQAKLSSNQILRVDNVSATMPYVYRGRLV